MQWSEVDLEKRLLTVAAPRMKGRKGKTKPHVVPLSTLALEVLERRRRLRIGDNPNVFGVDGPPPSHTFFALAPLKAGIKPLLADKPKSPIGTPHSFRSLFRDWASEIGNIPPDISEMVLAHRLPKIQAAYRRDSGIGLRTPVMESYGRWLPAPRTISSHSSAPERVRCSSLASSGRGGRSIRCSPIFARGASRWTL